MDPMMFATLAGDRQPAIRGTLEREIAAARAAMPRETTRRPGIRKAFGL